MSLRVVRIADRGKANQERVHLTADTPLDLSFYVVLKSLRKPPTFETVVAGTAAAFWFAAKSIKAGDDVVLYSCPGSSTATTDAAGKTTHFYYWGFKQTLWNNDADCVVVFQTLKWDTSPFGG